MKRSPMTVDAEKKYRLLTRLCQALPRGEDARALFLHAGEIFHELTGCHSAALVLTAHCPLRQPGFAIEFGGSLHCSDLPAERQESATICWVLEHGQPRL